MDSEMIFNIATKCGVPAVVALLFVFIFFNAEKILIWKGILCQFFSWLSPKIDKTALSSKVRGSILKAHKDFNELEKEILPPDLRVEWVSEESPESFIDNDQVIVRVKRSRNPHENLISTTAAYVNEGLLHNHKRYLDKGVLEASKIAMIRKFVQNIGKNSLTFFEENYLPQFLQTDDDVCDMYGKLKTLDKNGMFINILLREFFKAADGLFGDEPDPCLIAESRELVRFLYDIAMRETNEDTNLLIKNNYFKIAIILTGRDEVLNKTGIKPYLKKIIAYSNEGYDTIYVLAIGKKIIASEDIAKHINNDETCMLYARQYPYKHIFKDGKKKDAVIYEISNRM